MCPGQMCNLNATDLYEYFSVCFWGINWWRTYDAILQVISRERACSLWLICYKNPGEHVILYTRNLQNETLHGSVCWCRVLQNGPTGWRRLIGSPKLQIIFHKRATKYRSLLRKMTKSFNHVIESQGIKKTKNFTLVESF